MSEPAWVPLGAAPSGDPGVEVAYGEFTAGISITGASSPGTLIVAAPPFTADGTSSYFVDFFVPKVTGYSMQNPSLRFELFDETTNLGFLADWVPNSSAGAENVQFEGPLRAARRLTPAAGSRSYNVKAWHGGSNPPAVYGGLGGAGVLLPGFLRVTKVPSGVQIPIWSPQPVAVVTALPASPVDGQEIILVDSLTAPTYSWHLKFIAAKASNKWVFVGGAPLSAEVQTADASFASTSYAAAATAGPSVTPPVTGLYTVEHGYTPTGSGGFMYSWMSYDIGATGAVDADSCSASFEQGGQLPMSVSRAKQKSLTGGQALVSKYKVSGLSITLGQRWLRVTPIAVGG